MAKFDKKILKYGTFGDFDYKHGTTERKNQQKLGAYVSFDIPENATLKMKIGTSFTSIENARLNLNTEIPSWDFERTKLKLENTWNEMLSRIEVESENTDELTKFYTSMYHSLFHPRLYSDVNGEYRGFGPDSTVHVVEGFDYYCDFSNWDIYRAQMPLLSIIAPGEYNDMVKSLVVKAEQGGWLPIFPMWNNYTSAMIGDHSTSIIADAFMKGFDFDINKAYQYMHKNAFEIPPEEDYKDGKGRRALESYIQFGFIPLEDEVPDAFHKREQVSRTLEYAYNDWCVAQVAKKLDKTDVFNELSARSLNYSNVFDETKGWMCGRYADGTFTEDFDPNKDMFYITEGTPKHYTWYVPHDMEGLTQLMGGKETFKRELNQLIKNKEYWHGNEPSHQIPFLFNYVDQWDKTQQTVKNLLITEYDLGPGGVSGNDDAGQMSAWYIFGSMGFYPVCPGNNEYQLSSPTFEKITLNLDKNYYPGGKFILKAESAGKKTIFNKAKLNGKEIGTSITHEDIQNGGRLEFLK
jgi:predicted alpha-1,2-mannosidase